MFKLIFAEEVREDVNSTAKYYNEKAIGLGTRFLQNVRDELKLIKENPHSRAIRYDTVRLAVLDKFPYSIHFSINGKIVIIHAVISDYCNYDDYLIGRQQK